MNFRTDLAIEKQEYTEKEKLDGVLSKQKSIDGIKLTTIEIINEKGEKLLSKPKGRYITIETKALLQGTDIFSSALDVLSEELKKLLPEKGTVLVAGLGNDDITPDALGPKVMSLLLATRHISSELAESLGLGSLRSVAGIIPGVLGKTGIETVEIISGIVKKIKPCCVIAVDALASRNVARLGTTVQMCDTGVSPGSGVGNRRKGINKETLGVPVIAIGVPTVVDAVTMAFDIFEKAGVDLEERKLMKKLQEHKSMMVTPKEVDNLIDKSAHLIAMAINRALQPSMSVQDIMSVVG
ncbi:MAG: GPR endopeptidase [Clostridia bacterium]|nr:GPR endopeptidase [Clostridia bacterium]